MKTTQAQLKERYRYDPDTGIFTWRVRASNNAPAGAEAGTVNNRGYRTIRVGGALVVASRVAWCYMTGEWPQRSVVFVDGDRTNCTWTNLRLAGDQEEVTQERVREVFDYDPATGHLIYRRNRGGYRLKGEIAGFICKRKPQRGGGYRLTGFNGREYGVHHLVWVWHHGYYPRGYLDHINLDRADNRIENLRECTQSQNMANRRLPSNNTSGFKGVTKAKTPGKWLATAAGKHLGTFESAGAAHEAYKVAMLAVYGEFARFS